MTLTVRVPGELSARVPAEQRGRGRDDVRLLVSRGTEVTHHAFRELPGLLRAGDLLVVNTSPTLAAAVDGRIGHARVVVHFSTRGDDGRWAVELRTPDGTGTTHARAGGPAGTEVSLPEGIHLTLEEPLSPGSGRLWWARVSRGGGWYGRTFDGAGAAGPHRISDGTGPGPGQRVTPGTAQPGSAAQPDKAPDGTGPGSGAGTAEPGGTAGTARPDGSASATQPGCAVGLGGGVGAVGPGRAGGGAQAGGVLGAGRGGGPPLGGDVVPWLLRAHGRPIRYSYTARDQPLSVYQTVFALPGGDGVGSAEMPSAARPFTARTVVELVSRGVLFAPVTLHTGVASAEAHEPPYPERFAVPEASARLVGAVRAGGGRVIAVGTTAVRALESAAGADGVVRARAGWTDLVVTPERGVSAVDGLLTGLHEPEASHLLMLEAVAGRAAVGRGYDEALRGRYLWHEFGDVHLLLPEATHPERCFSN